MTKSDEIVVADVAARPIAAVRSSVPVGQVATAWRPALDKVWAFLRAHDGLRTDGHRFPRRGRDRVHSTPDGGLRPSASVSHHAPRGALRRDPSRRRAVDHRDRGGRRGGLPRAALRPRWHPDDRHRPRRVVSGQRDPRDLGPTDAGDRRLPGHGHRDPGLGGRVGRLGRGEGVDQLGGRSTRVARELHPPPRARGVEDRPRPLVVPAIEFGDPRPVAHRLARRA